MILCFGGVANFFVYQAFLTGTYNYRNHELLKMRSVPLVLKLALSTSVAGFMVNSLYTDGLYNEELYRISLKYRAQFDPSFQE